MRVVRSRGQGRGPREGTAGAGAGGWSRRGRCDGTPFSTSAANFRRMSHRHPRATRIAPGSASRAAPVVAISRIESRCSGVSVGQRRDTSARAGSSPPAASAAGRSAPDSAPPTTLISIPPGESAGSSNPVLPTRPVESVFRRHSRPDCPPAGRSHEEAAYLGDGPGVGRLAAADRLRQWRERAETGTHRYGDGR